MKSESFKGVGDFNIFLRSWRPEGEPCAVVVIVHGFNSHGGYYNWVAEQFVARGLAVFALDLRGRGQSDGERFYVEKFSDYVEDVAKCVNIAKSREPGLPVFVLGHSAGGVISCGYALEYQSQIAGLICESFAFQVPAPDFALAVLKGVSHVFPHAHVLKLKTEDFSRDQKVIDFMLNDPLIANEVQPSHTVAEMVRADERLKRDFGLITLPLLILHGEHDKVTLSSGSKLFYEKAGSKDKTLKIYEEAAHDLLNDFDKQLVLKDIQAWIDTRVQRA